MKINLSIGYSVVLHILLVGLATNVFLLSKQITDLRQIVASSPTHRLAEGDSIPPVAVRELDGNESQLVFEGASKETLLLVFTTTCPVCKRNQGAWNTLYEQFNDRFNIVGISASSIDATNTYKADHSLPFRVVVPGDSANFARTLGISTVPQTLHIGKDGKLRGLWPGPLSEDFPARLRESALSQQHASLQRIDQPTQQGVQR